MGTLSQVQKIIRFLKENQGQFFTARQIALFLVTKYASDYANKRNNPRFADDKAFLSQIIAEIGSQKDALKRANPALTWQDRPKPRRYCIPLQEVLQEQPGNAPETNSERSDEPSLLEQELYPLLISYLSSELHLYLCASGKTVRGIHGALVEISGCTPTSSLWSLLIEDGASTFAIAPKSTAVPVSDYGRLKSRKRSPSVMCGSAFFRLSATLHGRTRGTL